MEYVIKEKIYESTDTELYLCEDSSKRKIVCKIGEINGQVTKEGEILRRLSNPLFPRFIEYVEKDRAYLYREYIQGMTLFELLSRRHFLSVEKSVEFIMALADGLEELHSVSKGYVYRDLKPENVLVAIDGTLRLIDFGSIGEVGTKGITTGTIGFAAPEQFDGKLCECKKNMDIYGLAAMLFYMLVGLPISHFDDYKKREAVLREACVNKKLRNFILKCVDEDEAVRCPDILIFRNELLRACDKRLINHLKNKGIYLVKPKRFRVRANVLIDNSSK